MKSLCAVANPPWYVPAGIARREILGDEEREVARHRLERGRGVGRAGETGVLLGRDGRPCAEIPDVLSEGVVGVQ